MFKSLEDINSRSYEELKNFVDTHNGDMADFFAGEEKEEFVRMNKQVNALKDEAEKRAFALRDRLVKESGDDDSEDIDEFINETLVVYMQNVAYDFGLLYTDFDYYGPHDADRFWEPSTC